MLRKGITVILACVSLTINAQPIDVCVYGATSAGVIAAYTAKQQGKSVLLIEPTTRIGGMTTGGLGLTDIGHVDIIKGMAMDFYRQVGAHYGKKEAAFTFEPHVALEIYQKYLKDSNIQVLYQNRILSAQKNKHRIESITLENPVTGKTRKVKAKVFIDCSYEGDLMARAGVSYTVGRESNATYHETLNGVQMLDGHQLPDGIDPYVEKGNPASGILYGIQPVEMGAQGNGDKRVQAYNFRITLTNNPANRIEITKPENYAPEKYELLIRPIEKQKPTSINQIFIWSMMPNHKTDINNRNGFSTDMIGANWDYPEGSYAKRDEIFKDHLDYTKGLLYFVGHDPRIPQSIRDEIKHWGYPKDEYAESDHFTPQLYIREARRMIGRTVMTQAHCERRIIATDSIGWAAYNMDSHNCSRCIVNGMVKNEGNVEVPPAGIYPISYGAITPKQEEASNLIVPVCLSASHIAYGSIRMEPVFMVLGQSSAIAASIAIDRYNGCVQKVDSKEILEKFMFKDVTDKGDKFIDDLMSRMTVEEKIGQLNLIDAGSIDTGIGQKGVEQKDLQEGLVGGYLGLMNASRIYEVQKYAVEKSRLGIPLIFGLDVIHGYRTIFPIPLGLACTWDIKAIEQCARIAASEAAADGICWVYSPMVDISKDARWGRIAESAGEDPYLGSRIAEAYVKGYQGDKIKGGTYHTNEVMACVKHFALYGSVESGLDYNVTDMSRVRMYNDYLAPYHAAVNAGVGSVMSSFNTIDYVPATLSPWLLTKLLRDEWRFKGFVVTDWGSINEAITWGCGNQQETSMKALKAGTDMDMCSRGFIGTLTKSLQEGKISEADIDKACRRILRAKWDLGLFDNPYRYCDKKDIKKLVFTDEHRAFARKVATESFVLLKNEGNLLPLDRKRTIALIGPMADGKENMLGMWTPSAGRDFPYHTLLDAMRDAVGNRAKVLYAKGSNFYESAKIESHGAYRDTGIRDARTEQQLLDEALAVASQADIIVAAIGESQEMTGESSSRSDLNLPDTQMRLLKALKATGKPVVIVYFTGRPVVMKWEKEHIPAILNVWFGGSESANAICDILFGDVNPSGKLTTTFPLSTGHEPCYYNHLVTGRPTTDQKWFSKYALNYLDSPLDPVFPFGYGLSYTTFKYSDMTLSATQKKKGEVIRASITVSNTGKRAGDEVVQLYIHDVSASIARPVKELKGFKRIHLKPGESQSVTFEITDDLLSFYNLQLEHVVEPGAFNVMIGPNSQELLSKQFELK